MNKESMLSFEKSRPGRGTAVIPSLDVPEYALPVRRAVPPVLPELAECDVDRHYTELARKTFGVNCGFYPLGQLYHEVQPRCERSCGRAAGFFRTSTRWRRPALWKARAW